MSDYIPLEKDIHRRKRWDGPLSFSATRFNEEDKVLMRQWRDQARHGIKPWTNERFIPFVRNLRERGIDIIDLACLIRREG